MSIESWWGPYNPKRVGWGVVYLIIGLFLLFLRFFALSIFDWLRSHWTDLFWIIGWSSTGIGVGLLNNRGCGLKEDNGVKKVIGVEKEHWHFILYFGFALFLSSLASFALSRKGGSLDYPLSALIALTLGFTADRIHDLASIEGLGS